MKRNEKETKRNEKETKIAVIFASKQNEAKRKRNFFASMQKSVFSLVFASEAKRK
jgi:hypothetical protein